MLQGVISEFALSELIGEGDPQIATATQTLRYATHTFVTAADDTPASVAVEGRISGSVVIRRQISGGSQSRFGGTIETSINSELELNNADRGLDPLLGGYVDGRRVRIKIGTVAVSGTGIRTMPRYEDLQLALTLRAGAFSADQTSLRLRMRDPALGLQGEIQTRFYEGTGRREGGPEIAGRAKPLLWGRCKNIPAQLADEGILTYQLSSKPLVSIDAIYDSGVSVPIVADRPTYSSMVASDCPDGSAITCRAAGFFRLGSQAAGRVTANADGAGDDTAEIIDLILKEAGVDASDRSITSIADAANDNTGYHQAAGENFRIEDVISQLAEAAGAVFGADLAGVYRLVWLDAGALDDTPRFSFGANDLVELERVHLPYGVPWRSFVVGSARNWTVQGSEELAGKVSQKRRQFLELPFRQVQTADPDVATRHKTSRETALIPTFYSATNKAVAFANRMAAWYGVDRAMYQAIVKTALCQIEIGDICKVTAPRYNLDTGQSFMAVAVTDDLAAVETEILLYG